MTFENPRCPSPGGPLSILARALSVLALGLLATLTAGGAATRDREQVRGARGVEGLRVHEWGTFTSLQDEEGNSIGGLNVDDEPVPAFVHRIASDLVYDGRAVSARRRKGVSFAHPQVTMRLETPVVYFHLDDIHLDGDRGVPIPVDVRVSFRGGWLSEYYPDAEVVAPGVRSVEHAGTSRPLFGDLTPETVGSLSWSRLQVGVDTAGPPTDAHVWLAPRRVEAAGVRASGGESERYLFYRGVANREAPIRVVRDETLDVLRLVPGNTTVSEVGPLVFTNLWLVDIREDGSTAYRGLPRWTGSEEGSGIVTPASFDETDYRAGNLKALRVDMHAALVADGLHADEATAMLETWELSYFQSSGLRLFFLVPRAWTDQVLPLEVSSSLPVDSREMPRSLEADRIVRVMMGRIELVSPRQRQQLRRIAAGSAGEGGSGQPSPSAEQVSMFRDLGRFRHALLLNELQIRPTEPLRRFMASFGVLPDGAYTSR